MKRALLESVKVIPYTSGDVIDREGFLSAIVGANVSAAGTLSVAVTHSDEAAGNFTAVEDAFIGVDKPITGVAVEADSIANFDLDLIGCKRYIKITVTAGGSAAATYAVALGDKASQPV